MDVYFCDESIKTDAKIVHTSFKMVITLGEGGRRMKEGD